MKKVIGLCLVLLISSVSVLPKMANEVQKKEVIRHNVVKNDC